MGTKRFFLQRRKMMSKLTERFNTCKKKYAEKNIIYNIYSLVYKLT